MNQILQPNAQRVYLVQILILCWDHKVRVREVRLAVATQFHKILFSLRAAQLGLVMLPHSHGCGPTGMSWDRNMKLLKLDFKFQREVFERPSTLALLLIPSLKMNCFCLSRVSSSSSTILNKRLLNLFEFWIRYFVGRCVLSAFESAWPHSASDNATLESRQQAPACPEQKSPSLAWPGRCLSWVWHQWTLVLKWPEVKCSHQGRCVYTRVILITYLFK